MTYSSANVAMTYSSANVALFLDYQDGLIIFITVIIFLLLIVIFICFKLRFYQLRPCLSCSLNFSLSLFVSLIISLGCCLIYGMCLIARVMGFWNFCRIFICGRLVPVIFLH